MLSFAPNVDKCLQFLPGAVDIGGPINPKQCRGQLDGAITVGYGWTFSENMVHDEGRMANPQLRNDRTPALADTHDTSGPLGARSQGEGGINPDRLFAELMARR